MAQNIGNGWPVIDVRHGTTPKDRDLVTVYLRIPAELATPIDGGCSCDYCKAHPAETPKWDTIAVVADRSDHSWTVHYPQPRPITPAERQVIASRRRTA